MKRDVSLHTTHEEEGGREGGENAPFSNRSPSALAMFLRARLTRGLTISMPTTLPFGSTMRPIAAVR